MADIRREIIADMFMGSSGWWFIFPSRKEAKRLTALLDFWLLTFVERALKKSYGAEENSAT